MSVSLGSARLGQGGVFRAVGPEETLARVQPLQPVMGITRVANVTGLDRVGIPVVMVCRPNARSVAVAQGKGVSLAAAKASGLMESIESYHAERLQGPLHMGSLEEIQYSFAVADLARVPTRRGAVLSTHARLLWAEGSDLLRENSMTLVPYELVHLDFTQGSNSGSVFAASSNGLASGNTRLEAICHGICELLERDATTLWHMGGKLRSADTRIDEATVDDLTCRDLVRRFANANVALGIWDTTSDSGVPSFLCRAVPRDASSSEAIRPATGMGCHPDRATALCRALTEAAQSRLTFISGARDDLFREDYERLLGPSVQARWLDTVEGRPQRRFADVPSWRGDRLEDAVSWLLERLTAIGISQAIAVDLTRPEFDVPVVRMVVPGLEGIDDANYVPGARAKTILARAA